MKKIAFFKKGYILFFIVVLLSCNKPEKDFYNGIGKKPVYMSLDELDNIQNLGFVQPERTGTIFLIDTIFFMLEQRKGIHVYDISDESFPIYMTFFQIPAITDFTITGNTLYADSWTDFLTIDISNLHEIQLISRSKNIFQPILFPQLYAGFFDCVDPSKGAVVDWIEAELENARCRVMN